MSVAIASYNHAAFVRECIESVRAQTFTDWEIVVTDDGSTDGTREALESLCAEDPRIRLNAFPVNRGACSAVNDAIGRARGELVAVLNSDDRFHAHKLARQVAFLDAHPEYSAVFALPRFVDERGRQRNDESHKDHAIFRVENRTRAEWLRHFFRYGNCLCHPTLLIRRSCYGVLGGYDPRLAQVPDLDMWVRLCTRHELFILQEPLIDFRILDGERNASAARPEVIARDAWERLPVLRHYLHLDRELFDTVFPPDFLVPDLPADTQPRVRLARLALAVGAPAHRALALEILYEAMAAMTPGKGGVPDHGEWVRLTGECDVFGQRALRELDERLTDAQARLDRSAAAERRNGEDTAALRIAS